MKKLAALTMTLMLLLTMLTASADYYGDEPIALVVNDHEMTSSELKSAATLYMFEAALQCASNGYGFDMLDALNIEDEMDKLVFDLEMWYTAQDLAESMGLYPLSEEAAAAAEASANATWERYCEIARSEAAHEFLPGGVYEHLEEDPEGNIVRYFAYFGLTKEALLQKAIWDQADNEVKKVITAPVADQSNDDIIMYYSDWFLAKMDEQYIVEDKMAIADVMLELEQDPGEIAGGDDFELYEQSIMIDGRYYILGESTIRDFEANGWKWTQDADGKFAFQVTEEGNYFYARTDNNTPDGKLVMVDMFYAYEIAYDYLGFGFDLAFDPDNKLDIITYLEEYYDSDYTDEGVLYAYTEVPDGTLLIEVGEYALRLTLQ